MHSDWSGIVAYLAIITSCKVIIARGLNFKMAASRFGQCFRESSTLNRIKLDSFAKSTKDIKDLKTLFERKI